MIPIDYPDEIDAEFLALLERAGADRDLRAGLMTIFTAELCDATPKLAAFQWLERYCEEHQKLLALYAKHRTAPTGRWWPEIVAGCLWLSAAWHGHRPSPKDFVAIVAEYLEVSTETAEHLVRFCNIHEQGTRFHLRWLEIVSEGPGLSDMLSEAGL